MVLSDRSKMGEVMTMLTSRPDRLAPDSTAQACLDEIVALFYDSIIINPYVWNGKVASGSCVRKLFNTTDLFII